MSVFRNGATALITGGASGIGYAVAELCLRHGMRVAIADFNNEILELAKKNLGNVETFHADVSQQEQWKKQSKVKDSSSLPSCALLHLCHELFGRLG